MFWLNTKEKGITAVILPVLLLGLVSLYVYLKTVFCISDIKVKITCEGLEILRVYFRHRI